MSARRVPGADARAVHAPSHFIPLTRGRQVLLFPKLEWRKKRKGKKDVTDERPGTVATESETVSLGRGSLPPEGPGQLLA